MPSTISAPLAAEFDAAEAYLNAVNEMLRERNMPDMSKLMDKIHHLCVTVQGVEDGARKESIERLRALLEKLNDCEKQIVSFEETLSKSGNK